MYVDALVDHAFLRRRDVLQIDRRAIDLADDQIVVLAGIGQLALRFEQEGSMRAVELPGAGVTCPAMDGVHQVVERQIASRHRRRICFYAQCRLRAVHGDLAHARQNADALADLGARVIPELPFGDAVAGKSDINERLVVRVRFAEGWWRWQVDWQLRFRLRDRGLHVGGGGINALRERELQDEAGVTLPAVRGHKLKPGNLHELTLERRGHVVGHGLGRGARIAYAHLDDGVVHGR